MANTPAHTRARIKEFYQDRMEKFKSGKIETEPTYADVAREFHVSYDQARNACIGRTTAKKGKDSAKRSHSRRPTANTVENEARSIFELYEHEYKATLLQMQKDKNLSVNERVKLLTTLADGKAKMQRVEIEHHLKRADANVVSRLVRLFQPDATDTDVVKYYKEAAEMLRIEESSK